MQDKKQPKTILGKAGELHQLAGSGFEAMTTNQGVPISDDQNSLRAGARGSGLLEDFYLREKLFHFDHERIPERVVHARGVGVHGYFETLKAIPEITRASIFQKVGERTPVFARFSTVTGSLGSMDLARDVRGFAVKFYTKTGNWDLVGNNIPVFFIQDAIKFPDLIHSVKPAPDRDFPQAQTAHDNFWDFISFTPEAMHMIMWIMSDRAIPRSLRFMEGFGVHTFRMINKEGKSHFVKFHWKPKLGMQSVIWDEAVKINGADPDFHRRDMWENVTKGNYPEWELGLQIFDEEWAERFDFDVLDPTKLIPEEVCPVQIVGRMILNRMPDNFFAETEQVAFCTQNIIDGIDFTDDPLLQGRNFSYLDTQIKRLGSPNFTHLPINAPKCPVHNFFQDGHMAFHNPKGRANYEPNSWGPEEGAIREQPNGGFISYPQHINGAKLRERSPSFADHYSQARQFYLSQTDIEKQHIINALGFELAKCQHLHIREAIIAHLLNIDHALAEAVAQKLNIVKLPEPFKTAIPARHDLAPSDALSILKNPKNSFQTRKIAILVDNHTNITLLKQLEQKCLEQNITAELVALAIGGIADKDNKLYPADHQIDGAPSVLFDAVIICLSHKAEPETNYKIKNFICDAYTHYKFIGYLQESEQIIKNALNGHINEGFFKLDDQSSINSFLEACKKLRCWERDIKI